MLDARKYTYTYIVASYVSARTDLHEGDVLELVQEPAVDLGQRVHAVHCVAALEGRLHREEPAVGPCIM